MTSPIVFTRVYEAIVYRVEVYYQQDDCKKVPQRRTKIGKAGFHVAVAVAAGLNALEAGVEGVNG